MAIRLNRDSQQWVFDRTIQETGKVFHFQGQNRGFLPRSVHQHSMISKHLGKVGLRLRQMAAEEEAAGHDVTALELYYDASTVLAQAQHTVFENNAEKLFLHGNSIECYDRVRDLAPYRLERVEIPWGDRSVYGNLHLLPDGRRAPCVIFIPGCDMTKEMYPHPLFNDAAQRGMHMISIDGPGQGENNIAGTKLRSDSYEHAVSAVVDYLLEREEVDSEAILLFGMSFGSFWSFRAAAHEKRLCASAHGWASICDKHYLMNVESPRYKQLFAYLTGARDETELDSIIAEMTTVEQAPSISAPALLTVGEYDPRSPLQEVEAIYDKMTCEKELWVFEDQHHMCTLSGHTQMSDRGAWNLDAYWVGMDWLADRAARKPITAPGEVKYLTTNGLGPSSETTPYARTWIDALPGDQLNGSGVQATEAL